MRSRRRYRPDALILYAVVEILSHSDCLVRDLRLRDGVLIDLAMRLENHKV